MKRQAMAQLLLAEDLLARVQRGELHGDHVKSTIRQYFSECGRGALINTEREVPPWSNASAEEITADAVAAGQAIMQAAMRTAQPGDLVLTASLRVYVVDAVTNDDVHGRVLVFTNDKFVVPTHDVLAVYRRLS